MKTVVLVSGKLQSGKNQFTDYLKEYISSKDFKVSQDMLARDVKEMSAEIFKPLAKVLAKIKDDIMDEIEENTGWAAVFAESLNKLDLNFYNYFEQKTEISRCLLQIFGTDIGRALISETYWIEKTINRLIASKDNVIVLTDVRFPNEIDDLVGILYTNGIKVVTVRVNREMERTALENEHESEKALDGYKGFDYIVGNNYDLETLNKMAILIGEEICGDLSKPNTSDYEEYTYVTAN
jgi:hypothetical protein